MSGDDLVNARRGSAGPAPRFGIVDMILTLAAVAAVSCVAYFGISYWLTSGSTPPASLPPATAEAQPALAEVAWTEADAKRCKSAGIAAANAPVPGEFMLAKQSVTPGFAGLATDIECQLTRKPTRFCDREAKAGLVAMINDYLGRWDIVKLGMAVEGAPMVAMGEIFGGEISGGSDMYQLERDHTLGFMKSYHELVANGLKALGRDGIISANDFGGLLGVPAPITDVLGGITPERQLCG
jgi:hypothetical protein